MSAQGWAYLRTKGKSKDVRLRVGVTILDKARQFEASATPEYRVRIMTWDELLHNRLHQLNFVQAALNVTTNADTGMDRLRTIHGAHLPKSVIGEGERSRVTAT